MIYAKDMKNTKKKKKKKKKICDIRNEKNVLMK